MRRYDFPVDYGVPLPPKGDYKRRYPFRGLKQPGASFLVPCDAVDVTRVWNSLTRSASWASYKTGWRFTMRRVLEGVRVWRIE